MLVHGCDEIIPSICTVACWLGSVGSKDVWLSAWSGSTSLPHAIHIMTYRERACVHIVTVKDFWEETRKSESTLPMVVRTWTPLIDRGRTPCHMSALHGKGMEMSARWLLTNNLVLFDWSFCMDVVPDRLGSLVGIVGTLDVHFGWLQGTHVSCGSYFLPIIIATGLFSNRQVGCPHFAQACLLQPRVSPAHADAVLSPLTSLVEPRKDCLVRLGLTKGTSSFISPRLVVRRTRIGL